MTKAKLRGHDIEYINGQWVYSDTAEPTITTHLNRPCGHCGKFSTADEHDACLGNLPGVMNACCGHGVTEQAYVQYMDGTSVHGEEAIDIQNRLRRKRQD